MSEAQETSSLSQPMSHVRARIGDDVKDRLITQAFVAGQMDAQLKHADDLTRPTLKLLQARAYQLAQETAEELINTAAATALVIAKEQIERTGIISVQIPLKAIDDLLADLLVERPPRQEDVHVTEKKEDTDLGAHPRHGGR